ncbi:uncharacterized protein LOC125178975 [Hyalella azteca]|uniref:Uncharacterized protein LOC125178975 n=1 Tax=Hyalella azteca TaxID=294128 RepID=A0A979FTI4_HYAAZ|nr:uncharacterized protein LOC125178975 [Hyalella azteca]
MQKRRLCDNCKLVTVDIDRSKNFLSGSNVASNNYSHSSHSNIHFTPLNIQSAPFNIQSTPLNTQSAPFNIQSTPLMHDNNRLERHDNNRLERHDNNRLERHDNNRLEQHDNIYSVLRDNNRLEVHDNNRLALQNYRLDNCDNNRLRMLDNSYLELRENSRLTMMNNSYLELRDNNRLDMHDNNRRELNDNNHLEVNDNNRLERRDNNRLDLLDNNRLEPDDDLYLGIRDNKRQEMYENMRLGVQNDRFEGFDNKRLTSLNKCRLEMSDNSRLEMFDYNRFESHDNNRIGTQDDKRLEMHENNRLQVNKNRFEIPNNNCPEKSDNSCLAMHRDNRLEERDNNLLEMRDNNHLVTGANNLLTIPTNNPVGMIRNNRVSAHNLQQTIEYIRTVDGESASGTAQTFLNERRRDEREPHNLSQTRLNLRQLITHNECSLNNRSGVIPGRPECEDNLDDAQGQNFFLNYTLSDGVQQLGGSLSHGLQLSNSHFPHTPDSDLVASNGLQPSGSSVSNVPQPLHCEPPNKVQKSGCLLFNELQHLNCKLSTVPQRSSVDPSVDSGIADSECAPCVIRNNVHNDFIRPDEIGTGFPRDGNETNAQDHNIQRQFRQLKNQHQEVISLQQSRGHQSQVQQRRLKIQLRNPIQREQIQLDPAGPCQTKASRAPGDVYFDDGSAEIEEFPFPELGEPIFQWPNFCLRELVYDQESTPSECEVHDEIVADFATVKNWLENPLNNASARPTLEEPAGQDGHDGRFYMCVQNDFPHDDAEIIDGWVEDSVNELERQVLNGPLDEEYCEGHFSPSVQNMLDTQHNEEGSPTSKVFGANNARVSKSLEFDETSSSGIRELRGTIREKTGDEESRAHFRLRNSKGCDISAMSNDAEEPDNSLKNCIDDNISSSNDPRVLYASSSQVGNIELVIEIEPEGDEFCEKFKHNELNSEEFSDSIPNVAGIAKADDHLSHVQNGSTQKIGAEIHEFCDASDSLNAVAVQSQSPSLIQNGRFAISPTEDQAICGDLGCPLVGYVEEEQASFTITCNAEDHGVEDELPSVVAPIAQSLPKVSFGLGAEVHPVTNTIGASSSSVIYTTQCGDAVNEVETIDDAVVLLHSPRTDILNNQVPPGIRANNYWDNFRSNTHQNLLSHAAQRKADPNIAYRVVGTSRNHNFSTHGSDAQSLNCDSCRGYQPLFCSNARTKTCECTSSLQKMELAATGATPKSNSNSFHVRCDNNCHHRVLSDVMPASLSENDVSSFPVYEDLGIRSTGIRRSLHNCSRSSLPDRTKSYVPNYFRSSATVRGQHSITNESLYPLSLCTRCSPSDRFKPPAPVNSDACVDGHSFQEFNAILNPDCNESLTPIRDQPLYFKCSELAGANDGPSIAERSGSSGTKCRGVSVSCASILKKPSELKNNDLHASIYTRPLAPDYSRASALNCSKYCTSDCDASNVRPPPTASNNELYSNSTAGRKGILSAQLPRTNGSHEQEAILVPNAKFVLRSLHDPESQTENSRPHNFCKNNSDLYSSKPVSQCTNRDHFHNDHQDLPVTSIEMKPSYLEFPPSDTNFPPSNVNFPPSNANFPPYNGSFPPPNATFPSSSANFPPTEANFPPSNVNFPPSNSNFPHSNANFPHPNANFPHSNANFPHSNANFPHSNANFPRSNVNHLPSDSKVPRSNEDLPQSKTNLLAHNVNTLNSNLTFPPSHWSFPPSELSFPPSNASFPPSNANFPPSYASFPPSNASFPPSNANFPPSNANFPPSNANFPPSNNRVSSVKNRVPSVKNRVSSVKNRVPSVKNRVSPVKNRVPSVKNRIHYWLPPQRQ